MFRSASRERGFRRWRPRWACLVFAGLAFVPAPSAAFNPPVDQAGPLTATIEGPALVRQQETPLPLCVVLENRSARPIQGELKVCGIDRWRIAPAGGAAFSVPGEGRAVYDFTITAGAGTYNAYYPLHAYAKFTVDGAEHTAHPILILKTQFPAAPLPVPENQAAKESSPTKAANRAVPLRPAPAFPPSDNHGARLLGRIEQQGRRFDVRFWQGQRGLLDAVIDFQCGDKRLSFHGFEVTVADHRLDDPDSPAVLLETVEETCAQGVRFRHRFGSPAGRFDLVQKLWIERGALRVQFQLENAPAPQPWHVVRIEDAAAGPWNATAAAAYAGDGNVVRQPGAFRLSYGGHMLSTSFVGFDFADAFSLVQGVDVPPTLLATNPATRRYSLHTAHTHVMSLIPAGNVWAAVKTWRDLNDVPAAGGVKKLAGRFNFDLWHGGYAECRAALQRAFRYGLTNSVVVWHCWQRWGYDYRLPDVFPPNARQGDPAELRAMSRLCRDHGVLWAPHDNYIDFYPDADGFSYEKTIAFRENRQPSNAWVHVARDAHSYRYRPSEIAPFMQRNLPAIRAYLEPQAYFIDCWGNIAPYDVWTPQGEFMERTETRDIWRRQFAWVREFLGNNAPTISESGDDALIGWLDGAQTNHLRIGKRRPGSASWFVWNWRCQDAERIPWIDAAYHDRFVLLGAGYPSRYAAGLDHRAHGIYSDDYISTEVLTGHPGMVSQPFGRDVVRKYWLTNDLMRALALQQIEHVDFAAGNVHRQHVHWSNGDVWVNRGEEDWVVAGRVLPQYGFYARVTGAEGPVEAAVCRERDAVVEMSRSPQTWYVNGRQGGWDYSGPRANTPLRSIAIGPLEAGGGYRLTVQDKAFSVTPLPRTTNQAETVRIRLAALPTQLPNPTLVESVAEDGRVLARETVQSNDGVIALTCKPGVFAYRFIEK